MKRSIILSVCFLVAVLSAKAAGIVFLDNPVWTSVLEKAKKENKIIFLDGYTTWCGPCKKMDAETYTHADVASYFNQQFINVKYDMEKGEGPMLADRFYINAYPNLVFISPDGVLLHKAVGFLAADEFLALGKLAINPQMQYYTIKKGALKLNSKDFLQFAEQATDLQDDDFEDIEKNYLAAQADILGDPYLIDLVMKYVITLPKEENLTYLKQQKSLVLREGKYTGEEFDNRLLDLVMQYALSNEVQMTDEMDFDAVKKLLDKYVPEEAYSSFNFFKINYALEQKNSDDAVKVFYELFTNHQKIDYQLLGGLLAHAAPALFEAGKLDEVLARFDEIKLTPSEQTQSYLNNFVKAIAYLKTGQDEKFRAKAKEVLANKNTPEEYKVNLKKALQKMDVNSTK